jgi:hypothetical protein
MNQFSTPKVFQAKPSNLKKKVALVAFAVGAISFTLAVTGVISEANGAPFFAGGLVVMAFAVRFWLMQVRSGPTAVTFDASGITIANRSSSNTIAWAELEAIRYRATRGGHFWEFKSRSCKKTVDYYVDGLTSTQLEEMRETISTIKLPNVLIELFYNPLGLNAATD